MTAERRHECVAERVGRDSFRCRACSFVGTLREAIGHVIANQYREWS